MYPPMNLRIKPLAIGAVIAALLLAVSAHGAANCLMPPARDCVPQLPLPGMGGQIRAPFEPPLPYLRSIELAEPQRDKLFDLMLAQAPAERAQIKEASKALAALRQLAATDHFDAEKAQVLASSHGQALAKLAQMHAEFDSKVRALLTPEQRKQAEELRTKAEAQNVGVKCP